MAKEEGPRSPDPHLEGVLAGGGTPSLGWGYGGERRGLLQAAEEKGLFCVPSQPFPGWVNTWLLCSLMFLYLK